MAIICSTVIFSASTSSCSPVTMATTLKVWRFASFESSRNPIRGVCWNLSLIEVVGCCAQLNAPQCVMDGQSISETKQVVIRQYMRIEVSIEFSACIMMKKHSWESSHSCRSHRITRRSQGWALHHMISHDFTVSPFICWYTLLTFSATAV